MNYFDVSKIEEVIITFENMQRCCIEGSFIKELGVERSKWPDHSNEYARIAYPTKIMLDKEIYRSPEIFDRLCQYRDIAWIDVVLKDSGRKCIWSVPWEDDPRHEDENMLQRNIQELPCGIIIYIDDYNY